jgi:photosystem II stability/assembly factor-like uncharacterized protein
MRAIVSSFAVGMVIAGAALSPPALANGRFPESQRLLEHPGDPNRLYLAATYGLLLTEDRGKNWYSICEQAFSGQYVEGDPLLEVLADGTLISGIYARLNVSRDCGCGWTPTMATQSSETVGDLAVAQNGHLLATVRDLSSGMGKVRVRESVDGGTTWTLLASLPDTINDAYTIDVAPSDPNRIYISAVTAMSENPAVLLVSKDGGKTWTQSEIPGTSGAIQPFIAAVHPTNPDLIFVRTDDWEAVGDFAAQDALLVSSDGGKTWTELLRKNAKLFGFALSPDGGTVLAGYGDPVQAGGRTANSDDFGIYKASTAQSMQFARIYAAAISCLRWTGQGLYACMVQNHPDLPSPGMGLGFSPTVNFTMTTPNPFTSLLDVKEVKGPLGCTAPICDLTWSMPFMGNGAVCEQLEATCAVDATKNVLSCPGTGGGTGGAGNATGGASGSGGAAGNKDAGTGGGGGGGGGCGCTVSSPGSPLGSTCGILAIAASLLLSRRWRTRRRRVTLVSMDRARGGRRLLVLVLLIAGAMSSGACGANGEPSTDVGAVFHNCEDRGEDFFAGIAKTSPGGVTTTIVAATPTPPANADDNDWTVRLTDPSGAPLLGATLVVAPYMVDHGHGAPNVIALEESDGTYHLAPVYLKMTGLWQVTLKATPAGGSESRVMFPICIPPR